MPIWYYGTQRNRLDIVDISKFGFPAAISTVLQTNTLEMKSKFRSVVTLCYSAAINMHMNNYNRLNGFITIPIKPEPVVDDIPYNASGLAVTISPSQWLR